MVVAVLGGVLAACGGAHLTDEDDIARAIKRAYSAKNAGTYCGELTTRRFIERVYESEDKCRAVIGSSAAPANDVAVSRIRVAGHAGTAYVRPADDLSGTVEVRKTADRWRLDAFGEDLLRLVVKEFLLGLTKVTSFDKKFVDKCASRVSTELPRARVARFSYAVFGERLSPDDATQFGSLLALCTVVIGEPNGEAVMGRFFEQAMRNDNPPLSDEERKCVIRRVDRSIAADLMSPGGEFRLTARARRAFAVAADACGYDASLRATP